MSPMPSPPNLSLSQKVFRGLLNVLPSDFRANFDHEMEGVFAEQRRDIEDRGGPPDFLKLWWETFLGIFRTAPREHWDILALGAQPSAILRMILRQSLLLTVLGVAIGALGALAMTGLLKSLLFQVAPTGPVTFVVVALVLITSALLASFLPARRAASIDPIVALRNE